MTSDEPDAVSTVSPPATVLRGAAQLFAALWRHAAGRRGTLLGAYALLLSAELIRLAVPWLTSRAIDAVQQQGRAGLAQAGVALAGVFGCLALAWTLHGPGRILERNVALHVRARCSRELLERLLCAPLCWHRGEPGAQRAHRVMQASGGLHAFAEMQYVYMQNIVMIVGPMVALWLLSPWVGLAASVGFGSLGLLSLRADRALVRWSGVHNLAQRREHAVWVELLGQVFTVQALRGWGMARRRVERALAALAEPLRHMVLLNEIKWAMVEVGSAAMWCGLVVLYVVLQHGSAAAGGVALGGLYMVYEYARRVETVMSAIASDFGQMARQQADHAAGAPILAAPREAVPLPALQATPWRSLRLLDVQLPWATPVAGAGVPRLSLQRGRRYAVVGPSGAGKSTLLRVLSGLEEPAAGRLEIDGLAVSAARLRGEVTLVPQEAELFEGTLDDNLLLGDAARAETCADALACVCADEFLDARAQFTVPAVSEGGANWSGGQRQRLALARGLLAARGGAMILLDEPTAALDPVTQVRVMSRLLAALDGQCVVATVHRMELLPMFDEVIVLDAGALVDSGPLAAVRQRCTLLRALESVDPPLSCEDAR